ncbi:hypothetical protein [Desulfocicer vacuolatum]|uniref:hypothetical protein n=1 Tax=Desulfocicer vacuolatum TaxID=2298 RepID=UPI001BAE995C|nr:hypothetical protein [Desulfocicer vacuolatum]
MKYSANQRRISSFVMGGTESKYGPPMAVYMKYSANQGCISNFVVGGARTE